MHDTEDTEPQPYDHLLDDPDPRAYDDEVPPPVGDADALGFIIEDEAMAAQAVDLINIKQERVSRIKASCAEMVKQAELDLALASAMYEEPLKRWAAKELEGKKRRSILLPTGKLQFTKVPARLVVRDEGKAIAWAKVLCPQAIKTTEKLLVSEVPANVAVWPSSGIEVQEEHDSFKIGGGK